MTTFDSPLLALATVLAAAIIFGEFAGRLRLPKVTGWICAGLLLRAAGLPWLSPDSINDYAGFVDFVLGYIAFIVGSALHAGSLRNARGRLALLALAELSITPLVVALALVWVGGQAWPLAGLLAAIAVAGAPGTTLVVLHEARSRGIFTKTLVGALPLVDLACLCVFAVVAELVQLEQLAAGSVVDALLAAALHLGIATAVGAASALLAVVVGMRWAFASSEGPGFILTILAAWGLAQATGTSGILACTMAGVTLTNVRHETARAAESYLAPFASSLFPAFYALAGMGLDFGHLRAALGVVMLYFLARVVGKVIASYTAMSLAGTITSARRYLGLALLPHGGVAIGLILVVQQTPGLAAYADAVTTIGLSALALNQLVGPSMTGMALSKVGESGLERSRLLDFLTEPSIVVGLTNTSRREVLRLLAERLVATEDGELDAEELCDRLAEADRQSDTCLGSGLMLPHTFEPGEGPIRGVLGLSAAGLNLGAPDGRPVHAVLLLVIPESEHHHHLEILAGIATLIQGRADTRDLLYHAPSPAHAHKLLNPPNEVGFNRFREAQDVGDV